MPARNIIVIGASAGGFEAIQTLVRSLSADLPAAPFRHPASLMAALALSKELTALLRIAAAQPSPRIAPEIDDEIQRRLREQEDVRRLLEDAREPSDVVWRARLHAHRARRTRDLIARGF